MRINLQLFANTSTQGGSTSHTEGGSSSHTEGGSSSHTSSHSETDSHTEGGSHSYSYGKSWASGKVEENTQAHRDAYNTDYEESYKVSDTYDRLQKTLDDKPEFESKFEPRLNELYGQIMGHEKFSYNFNADSMYKLYKDQYTAQGKRAMEDTMGQAAALTGGYGSSYSQSAGQQTYQNYVQRVNEIIPELREQAYQQYKDEGNELLSKYNVTADAYNREYGQYRDSVSDWQADRSFNYGMYSDERNFDYNQFTNERNYWNNEYWNERNAEHSNYQITDTNYWEDTHSETNAESQTDSTFWQDTESHNWQDSIGTSWSNSFSDAGAGGGGGGGKKGSKNGNTNNNWNAQTEFDPTAGAVTSATAGSVGAKLTSGAVNSILETAMRGSDTSRFLEDVALNGYNYNGKTYKVTDKDLDYIIDRLGDQGVHRISDEELKEIARKRLANAGY